MELVAPPVPVLLVLSLRCGSKQYRAVQGGGTKFLKHLSFCLAGSSSVHSFAVAELWKGRKYSFTFMPIPQQSKGHMRNGSSHAENVKEQDLHVIFVFLWCWVLFTHSCVCCVDHALFLLPKQVKKGGFMISVENKLDVIFFTF